MTTDKIIQLPEILTVKQLSEALDQPVTSVIGKLMNFGVLATINEDIDFDTAAIVADEFGLLVEKKENKTNTQFVNLETDLTKLKKRPPIVTIMGHVDHGKTSLLDFIRRTNVVAKEVGGITQHISSYQIELENKEDKSKRVITFLDTPGHSAFETMRKHGAQITDLVVLVVAADDGVKPQTVEAIKHAQNLHVPILVAINKIDKSGADIERVKRELLDYHLTAEEWGGNTVIISVSAKSGEGIPALLEMILLSTDMKNLQANFDAPAAGVVIEAHLELGIGPVATILIQNGTLRIGDYIAIGSAAGKVRTMSDHRGKKILEATPAMPVEISGLDQVPNFGDQMAVVNTDKEARDSARQNLRSQTAKRATTTSINTGSAAHKEGEKSILNVVVKADTDGSLEAIRNGLATMKNDDVEVRLVSDGVGDISETDVSMASTSKAVIIGFQVKMSSSIKTFADREKVSIHLYSIVYELFEAMREVLADMMPMQKIENEMATLKILARFRNNKRNIVIGGIVEDGTIMTDCLVRITKKKEVIAEGKIVKLQHGKEMVKSVKSGSECGMELQLDHGETVEKDDMILFYKIDEIRKSLNI